MKTSFLTKITFSLALTLGLTLAVPADAQVLIDFGNTATTTSSTGNPGYYWNNITSGGTISLIDITNASSGISVTATGFGGFSASGGIAIPTPGGMTGTAATEFGGLQQNAATDYIFGTGTNTGTLTFSGLTAGVTYEFTIFSARNTAGNFLTDFALNGGVAPATGQVNAQFNSSSVVVLSAQAVGTTLSITAKNNNVGGGNFYINAVEVVAVPEPASLTMVGAGAFGALCLTRRRSRSGN
jgi:hypothetical protein